MTPLTKPVTRRPEDRIRWPGGSKRLVVTLYPSGLLGLRPEKTRREEFVPLTHCYSIALKARIQTEREAKQAKRRGAKL